MLVCQNLTFSSRSTCFEYYLNMTVRLTSAQNFQNANINKPLIYLLWFTSYLTFCFVFVFWGWSGPFKTQMTYTLNAAHQGSS